MSEALTQTLNLPGCIDDKVYQSLRKYLPVSYTHLTLPTKA